MALYLKLSNSSIEDDECQIIKYFFVLAPEFFDVLQVRTKYKIRYITESQSKRIEPTLILRNEHYIKLMKIEIFQMQNTRLIRHFVKTASTSVFVNIFSSFAVKISTLRAV